MRRATPVLALIALAAAGTSYAAEPAGHTTVTQRIRGADPGTGFRFLSTHPGERHVLRQDRIGVALASRSTRRRSLLYFSQLSDFQLADEESPSRVEFVDSTANPPFPSVFSAAQRPQEALLPQTAESAIQQVNRFTTSPITQGNGKHAKMALSLLTGDLSDSQQLNEGRAVRTLLEGGTVNPNSGVGNAGCPPGTPGAAEAARYTGVQDRDDFPEGAQFYDPDAPAGAYATWPRWPGLMDRAQAPFGAQGLRVPSYVAFGNHDGLVQGNAAANTSFEAVATGCVKPSAPAFNPVDPQSALNPTYLSGLLSSNPAAVGLVPRDPDRRYVDHAQFKKLFDTGRDRGHGFGYVDPTENAAGAGHPGYYAWSLRPGFRLIATDTVSEGGVPGPSAEGNIDDPQFRWIKRQLDAAERADQLVVVFGHHPIRSLDSTVPDEVAGPCGAADAHGHGTNPGCDSDPRDSRPLHDGDDFRRLLLAHPHVIATVFGHTHENRVTPFAKAKGTGGFWGIESPSHADWPMQSRLIDVMDNRDGTLSIFGTVLDTDAPVAAPPPGSGAGAFGVPQLASIARTLAFNDTQAGGTAAGDGLGDGKRLDRNVELVIGDPRRSTGGGGRCAQVRGSLRGKAVGSAALGRRRATNRRRFPRAARSRPRSSIDRFCLVGSRNTRVGYPSRRFRKRMPRRERRRVRDRAVLALTSHPAYAAKRIRNGSAVKTMRRRFRGERSYVIGRNRWYLARGKRARVIFKTRRGRVKEVGLADLRLTSTRRKARRFLRAFSL